MAQESHPHEMTPPEPPETPYPPAPWRARAHFWAGLFRADAPATLPPGVRPLLGRRLRAVLLARYLSGSTLVYDELIVATPALLGARPGLYIDRIWVDSLASLWGGRRIWGLPKQLSNFDWSERGVRVSDVAGAPLLTLELDRDPLVIGPAALPLAIASIGRLGAAWTYSVFPMRLRLGRAGMRLRADGPALGVTLGERPLLSVASTDCRITFPAPRLLTAR